MNNEKTEKKNTDILAPIPDAEKKMEITELDDAQAENVAGGIEANGIGCVDINKGC